MARKLLKPFLICCFCICAAWFAAKIAIYLLVPPPLPAIFYQNPGEISSDSRAGQKSASSLSNGEAVLKRNLFHVPLEPAAGQEARDEQGRSPAEEALLRAEMEKLPIHKQGWVLLGTIVNTILPAQSRAILVIDSKQGAYVQGAEIKGWKIALIERRTVVVEKNGRKERLLVGGREIEAPQPVSAPVARASLNVRDIERALNNLPELMKQASFSATQKNGVYGINLTFVQPDSFLSRLGLRQDDLLTGANGQTLANIGDLATLGNLANQDALRLELVRNGQNIVLEYDITGRQ